MSRTSLLPSFLRRHASIALLLGAGAILGVACSTSDNADDEPTSSGGNAGPGSGGGGPGVGGGFNPATGSGGAGGNGFEECATSSAEANLIPVNMIIMFDRSGSMQDDNKWDDSTAALRAFLQDPESAGLRVALRFFPDNSCNEGSCSINDCTQPVVDVGPLTADAAPTDAQEELLVSAIANETPDGDHTPIYPSLGGAAQWAKDYAAAHPAEKAVVIYVTDGEPNGCDENSDNIAALAGEAFTSSGIYTYSVGLEGSNEGLMNLIAEQGGTTQGIFIGSGANAEQELLQALKAIQGSQVACEFAMPTPAPGETIDPAKVNVEYTPGSGGNPSTIGQVSDAAACTSGGWYYDNPAEPTKIVLCPDTCQAVQSDTEAKIRVVLGCATTPAT